MSVLKHCFTVPKQRPAAGGHNFIEGPCAIRSVFFYEASDIALAHDLGIVQRTSERTHTNGIFVIFGHGFEEWMRQDSSTLYWSHQ